jgi:hypothetical protein
VLAGAQQGLDLLARCLIDPGDAVVVGIDGQAVARDETLNGEPFSNTRHVSHNPLVGEAQVGLVVMVANGVRASFTQVWQTHEFQTQRGHLFAFSSAALSVKF